MAHPHLRTDRTQAYPNRRTVVLTLIIVLTCASPAPRTSPLRAAVIEPLRTHIPKRSGGAAAGAGRHPSVPSTGGVAPGAPTPGADTATLALATPPDLPEPSVPLTHPAAAVEVRPGAESPHLGPIRSPDIGEHCAEGLSAEALTRFFAERIGRVGGADYQRALRLPDDRVLWTFQDAFVDGALIHNIAMLQSGRCFTKLGANDRSWLLDDLTSSLRRWHWILDGVVSADGDRVHLFVAEMEETGRRYLSRTRPVAIRRVVLDATTLGVVDIVVEPPTGDDLYGWSVAEDAEFTYLYSHCYQQFGHDTLLGFGACASDVKLARVPRGRPDSPRTFWDGTGWSTQHTDAVPVIDEWLVFSGNNPAQIRHDGTRFVLVEKRDDWFGTTVEFASSDSATGPFLHLASVAEPLRCDPAQCNSYFATWLPWTDRGRLIWSISHNRWNGAETATHLDDYRPTFHSIELPQRARSESSL